MQTMRLFAPNSIENYFYDEIRFIVQNILNRKIKRLKFCGKCCIIGITELRWIYAI